LKCGGAGRFARAHVLAIAAGRGLMMTKSACAAALNAIAATRRIKITRMSISRTSQR
jgi:hypothetical protein